MFFFRQKFEFLDYQLSKYQHSITPSTCALQMVSACFWIINRFWIWAVSERCRQEYNSGNIFWSTFLLFINFVFFRNQEILTYKNFNRFFNFLQMLVKFQLSTWQKLDTTGYWCVSDKIFFKYISNQCLHSYAYFTVALLLVTPIPVTINLFWHYGLEVELFAYYICSWKVNTQGTTAR